MEQVRPHPEHGAPLTEADMMVKLYGVPVMPIGEDDTSHVIGLGHVAPLRFLAAAHALDRDMGVGLLENYRLASDAVAAVKHRWAIHTPRCTVATAEEWEACPHYPDCMPPDSEYDWYITFDPLHSEATPGAFPVTVLEMS